MTATGSELLDLVLMAADSFWTAKQYLPARKAYEQALELDPENLEALNRLGRIALASRKPAEALKWFLRSWELNDDPATAVNLAVANTRLKLFRQALNWCIVSDDQLLKNFQPAWVHRACVFEETGNMDEAEALVNEALIRFPGDPELLFMLSQHQLARGDFENGWPHYEHRPPRGELLAKLDEYPEWMPVAGGRWPVEGKTILVAGEQGFGDKIMFARYVPLLVELGAKVILFTSPELARLFAASLFVGVGNHPAALEIRIVTSDRELDAIEKELDCWVAMASLPLRWSLFENAKPVGNLKFPYLFAPRPEIDRFAALIPRDGTFRVGLCWKGTPEHRRDEYRSMSWETMRPLTEVPGCTFYSLQMGDRTSGLLNLTRYAHDMADTAAAIACLDLVISVDTAVLHLAGALGVPVWGLLGWPSDWRWGRDEIETPWYRSMRLIRSRGDWTQAIQFAMAALRGELETTNTGIATGFMHSYQIPSAAAARVSPAPDPTVTRECRYGPMTWYRNDTYIGRALDCYGEYSQAEVELFRRILKPGDVVVEAGANIGALTVALGSIVAGSAGVVYAFEPQPAYFDLLEANLTRYELQNLNRPGVTFQGHRRALGAEPGELVLRHVPLDTVHAPGWESTGDEFRVRVVTIDRLDLKRLNLIKIDVDGAELDILNGAEQAIARCRPLVYCENDKPDQYPDLLPWLHAHDYRLYQHLAPLYNPENFAGNKVNVFGSMVSAMILAVPQERKDLHFPDLTRIRVD